jgi:homoserine acetyltransferase
MVKRAAPIAGTAKNTDHDFLFTETLVEAITSDRRKAPYFGLLCGFR